MHIIEARNLAGRDLSGTSDPAVVVKAFGQPSNPYPNSNPNPKPKPKPKPNPNPNPNPNRHPEAEGGSPREGKRASGNPDPPVPCT